MATLRAFKALRPPVDLIEEVACVPYDVVNTEEARKLAEGKDLSFMRVVRSEVEFDPSTDPHADKIYARARDNFNKLIEKGALVEDETPGLYIYQIQMNDQIQTGVVGCSAVDEYDADLVKKHEKTRVEKEKDRTRHIVAIGAHSGPVFLTYKANQKLKELIAEEVKAEPVYNFTAEDGVRHTFWKASNSDAISEAFKAVPHTYIADGHHRAASSSNARAEMKKNNPDHTGDEEYNYFLSVLFPHDELKILPYNRIIKKLPESTENILSKLKEVYKVSENANPAPIAKGHAAMYLEGKWYGLAPLGNEPEAKDPVSALEVSVLHDKALGPIFGIGDPRTDNNIDFVGGIRGTKHLEELVDRGDAACAFSVYPTSIEELMQIADAGMIMAPKSTWFEPKLRSGIVVHKLQ